MTSNLRVTSNEQRVTSMEHALVVGLAREGSSVARFLAERGVRVTVSDIRTRAQLHRPIADLSDLGDRVRVICGRQTPELLNGVDVCFVSPGVPPEIPLLQAAREKGLCISSEPRLFLQLCPASVVGVTGSSGKTTTTTLVGEMLKATGQTVWVGGNIGEPLLKRLPEIGRDHQVVLELSSFQLEYFATVPDGYAQASGNRGSGEVLAPWYDGRGISPEVAGVLNITPNHLNRHPSMATYVAAKAHILRWQHPGDVVVLGYDNPITRRWLESGVVDIAADVVEPERHRVPLAGLAAHQAARRVRFPLLAERLGFSLRETLENGAFVRGDRIVLRLDGREQKVCSLGNIQLRGAHNVLNVLAACALAGAVGVPVETMAEVIRGFSGVAHRLELVRVRHGVQWINDSIATAPERAVAALKSFHEPIILLAGGRDKKLPWDEFAHWVRRKVRHLIVFGEAAGLIAEVVSQSQASTEYPLTVTHCTDLAEAVRAATRLSQPGEVVLLSPGGTSFDAYADFVARGEHFRELVRALPD
ncbi:MAG TPA: UDP-N-acetylmuramoyl-L-alanine--D-glutamate ligase [Anaerolineae bacterium]|nr:UDP-N-acetylmuramoyl-L-alanine--D-glutamate ligase [Anaerolineae bacterium]